ncbi:MAG: MFS transporter, partial [Bacteroidetes bacterium]|nr:MFS transporter [Bacteroidota bacterium]
DFDQSRTILIWAILFTTPFFVLFGTWSDRVGRKWIIVAGMLLATFSYRFLFSQLLQVSDEKNKTEIAQLQQVKTTLTPIPNSSNSLRTTVTKNFYDDGMFISETKKDTLYIDHASTKPEIRIAKTLGNSGYWKMVFIVSIMIFNVTIAYGPIVSFLVELFPTKIRYTSMSLPYHIGNGIFGGLTPFFATLLTTIYTGDKLVGLTYPIVISLVGAIICILYVNEKNKKSFDTI